MELCTKKGKIIMRINRVFAESHETGELTLKGFSHIKDTLPDDFEVCLIIEKNGHLSAGCWDTGLRSTDDGKIPGCFRQSRGGFIGLDDVLAFLPIEKAEIDIKSWVNSK